MAPAASIAIVTHSEAIRQILAHAQTIAKTDTSVLIIGETGAGKELLADYIHRVSARWDRPFIKISLSAMPHDLIESELFGHDRGAFTGALTDKKGLFEMADTGTLFLDDIDDVPQAVQAKLLRVLESGQVMHVGGTATIPVDVRVISASKVDLREMVSRNLFRSDLFYRLNVFPLVLPPLRDRREDVPLLVEHFLRRFAAGRTLVVSPDAARALMAYNWPGNVRELRNVAQRLALFCQAQITLADLPPEVHDGQPVEQMLKACSRCMVDQQMSFTQVVECLETNLLRQALVDANGNRTAAARNLGLSQSTLRDKLKRHGLDDEQT
jgi:DNA-binding NtrC family response regulator